MVFLTELDDSDASENSEKSWKKRDCRKWLSFLTFLIEGLLFTGIIFGFPNLKVILKREGIWTSPQETEKKIIWNIRSSWFLINLKDSRKYELVTTIAIKSGNVLSLPLGIILDRVGTFHCRICCQILITIGLILLIFTIYNPYLLFGSIPLLAAGGFTLLRKVQFLFYC